MSFEFIRPWKLTFDHFNAGGRLSAHHMMLGAAGIFYHKWGRSWPSKVVCILQGFEDHTPLNAMQHTMLSEFGGAGHCPILGVAFLYTPTHWMMFIHNGQVCVALDGYYLQSAQLQPLAKVALEHFVEAGMPRKRLTAQCFGSSRIQSAAGITPWTF